MKQPINIFHNAGGADESQGGAFTAPAQGTVATSAIPAGAARNLVTRAPNYTPVFVADVRDYQNKMSGKTMFAFNNGTLHLSYAQLNAAGVVNPNLLQGTTLMVDFYQVGEPLLNGTEVRDPNRIVRGFIAQKDMELEREVAKDAMKDRAAQWRQNILGMARTTTPSVNPQPTTAYTAPSGNPAGQGGTEA